MTPLTAATPKPLVTHTLTHTETHSRTLIPTHLSEGVWNWAGTWNEYSKQLSFSPASSNPFPMNIFTFAFFFSFSRPSSILLLFCYIFTSLFSPPSQVMASFPQGLGQYAAIMLLIYGSRSLSHNVRTVVTSSCKWHTMLAKCGFFLTQNECNIFLFLCRGGICDIVTRGKHIFKENVLFFETKNLQIYK